MIWRTWDLVQAERSGNQRALSYMLRFFVVFFPICHCDFIFVLCCPCFPVNPWGQVFWDPTVLQHRLQVVCSVDGSEIPSFHPSQEQPQIVKPSHPQRLLGCPPLGLQAALAPNREACCIHMGNQRSKVAATITHWLGALQCLKCPCACCFPSGSCWEQPKLLSASAMQ